MQSKSLAENYSSKTDDQLIPIAPVSSRPSTRLTSLDLFRGVTIAAMILVNNPGAVFFSIHQFPCYPGTGARNVGNNCFNYPVAPQTPRIEYRHVLESALDHLKSLKPEIVAVSTAIRPENPEVTEARRLGTR